MSEDGSRILAEYSKRTDPLQIHSILSEMISKGNRSRLFSPHEAVVYRIAPDNAGIARSVSLAEIKTSIARKTGRKEWRDILSVSSAPWGEFGRFVRYEYDSPVPARDWDELHADIRNRFDEIGRILRNFKFVLVSGKFDLIIDSDDRVWLTRVTELVMDTVERDDVLEEDGGEAIVVDENELFNRIDSAIVEESLLVRMQGSLNICISPCPHPLPATVITHLSVPILSPLRAASTSDTVGYNSTSFSLIGLIWSSSDRELILSPNERQAYGSHT